MSTAFARLLNHLELTVPGLRVRYKTDHNKPLWVILAFAIAKIFNRRFDEYTTTLGRTIWFPSIDRVSVDILAHEGVHLQEGRWFPALYLMPQLLALLCPLGLLWAPLWGLLIFIAPWPSPWRTVYELHAYEMTIAVAIWSTGEISHVRLAAIADQFTGWSYYRMSWRRQYIERALADIVKRVHTGAVLSDPYMRTVLEIVK